MRALPTGLYALCDDTFLSPLQPRGSRARSVVDQARELLAGGAPTLQVRLKKTPVREALGRLREIVGLARRAGAVCLVNDRVDWALLADADGVHLGDDDLPISEARRLLGPDRIIGGTVRTLEGCREAKAAGADYVGLGPLYGTTTKVVDHPALGISAFGNICAEAPLPVVGIAGIHLGNIGEVAAAGAHAAAVVSDALGAADVPERVRALIAAFERGAGERSVRPL